MAPAGLLPLLLLQCCDQRVGIDDRQLGVRFAVAGKLVLP